MERKNVYICMLAALLSCSDSVKVSRTLDAMPAIFPDYNGVVIPPNMAPLNFALDDQDAGSRAVFSFGGQQFEVKGENGSIVIPPSKWKKLLESAAGDSIQVTVQVKQGNEWVAYSPFAIRVAPEKVDSYLAYRLIDPGYELWNKMGIYQRDLESYTQIPIIENKMSGNNCVNCHSFCMQDPNKMLFHMRETFPGTILVDGDKIEKLNTKTKETISSLVYPSWHPSGKYVAFSVNTTKQAFHLNDRNRVEVYDEASDVVVYDVEKHEIVTASNIFSKDAFETFPTFSPDGKTLYFCTAEARPIPQEYSEVKYNLCSVSFDPVTFLLELSELAHLTPCGANAQRLRFHVVSGAEDCARVFDELAWAGALKDWPGPAEGGRPTGYIAILAERAVPGKPVAPITEVDTGIAAQTMMLAARSATPEVAACMFKAFTPRAIDAMGLNNDKYELKLIMAFGVPAETQVIDAIDSNPDGSINYWRDEAQVHHVPKRPLADVLL